MFTAKTTLLETNPEKCQVNYVVYDQDWEAAFAERLERIPQVRGYIKNHGLGFEVPYSFMGQEHRYRPDFLVHWDDGRPDPLQLVVEIKGRREAQDEAKADTLRSLWLPAVSNARRFGRWGSAGGDRPALRYGQGARRDDRCVRGRDPSRSGGLTMARGPKQPLAVATVQHKRARRPNNPTMELQSLLSAEEAAPETVTLARATSPSMHPELYERNKALDPQLVWADGNEGQGAVQLAWRGKDEQDAEPLNVDAVPIYTAEKVHPKAIIDDIRRRAEANALESDAPDLFADFNGIDEEDRLDFLPSHSEMDESTGSRRQPSGDGEPRAEGGFAWEGPVHLF